MDVDNDLITSISLVGGVKVYVNSSFKEITHNINSALEQNRMVEIHPTNKKERLGINPNYILYIESSE